MVRWPLRRQAHARLNPESAGPASSRTNASARNLNNKETARAMRVGEGAVKWHLNNLFGKLDAANRKHVVRRAQLLGLLEGNE